MSLTGTNNEEKIWNFLKAQGFGDCGAAGLMGNLYAESGLSATNLQNTYEKKFGMTDAEYTAAVDSGKYTNFVRDSAGYGLAQWTYWSRKQGLLDYAKAAGKSVGDLEAQLGYLIKELTSYGLLETVKTAKSVRDASNIVLLQFEKPASKDTRATQDKRAGYAQGFYDRHAKAAAPAAPAAPAPVPAGKASFKLVESILTKNPCYTAGKKITVKGLMLHSVGCPQPNAQVFVRNWNKTSYDRACVHGFIDANDGTAYQTLPWDHRGWHCAGSGNNTHIGVEMCEPDCIKYTSGANFTCSNKARAIEMAQRTYDTAVQLFAMLCKQFGLDPLKNICSHCEGHKLGIASGHADPEHLWRQLGMGLTMDTFRQAVKAAMGNVTVPASTPSPAPKPSAPSAALPYKVQVTIKDLNIRSGPGSDTKAKGCISPGVYTIVEEQTGTGATKWGKLKSGAGWIALDYCKKL